MDRTPSARLINDVHRLEDSLGAVPEPVATPVFIALSGLPGTGKSFVTRLLARRLSLAILESDALRKVLFPRPSYQGYENAQLFSAIHYLVAELLNKGISVVLDATNLTERDRRKLYIIADKAGVKLILVSVKAPAKAVKVRLDTRSAHPVGYSDADWSVYQAMKPR